MITTTTIETGDVKGKLVSEDSFKYTVFKGIPYGKNPTGDLRFHAPEKPDKWNDVYNAQDFGFRALQLPTNSFYKHEFYFDDNFLPPMNEDCLYLNVWTPALHYDDKLPVLVVIHGGAFKNGSGSTAQFSGAEYAKHGIITVTINYRLGIFGYLAHPWLEDSYGNGNYGLLDQIMAINWVCQNIAAFGGDPNRITLIGQSAGAMSIQELLSIPTVKSKISGAILSSGAGYNNPFMPSRSLSEAEKIGCNFTDFAGINSLQELRKIDANQLQALFAKFETHMEQKEGHPNIWFMPTVDGVVLPYGADEAIDKGEMAKVPYIIGSNRDDMMVTDNTDPQKSVLFRSAEKFGRKLKDCSVYEYYFTHVLPGTDNGAFHSAELWYVYHTLHRSQRPMSDADELLSQRIINYFSNFVKSGSPNKPVKVPLWKPISNDSDDIMRFE